MIPDIVAESVAFADMETIHYVVIQQNSSCYIIHVPTGNNQIFENLKTGTAFRMVCN